MPGRVRVASSASAVSTSEEPSKDATAGRGSGAPGTAHPCSPWKAFQRGRRPPSHRKRPRPRARWSLHPDDPHRASPFQSTCGVRALAERAAKGLCGLPLALSLPPTPQGPLPVAAPQLVACLVARSQPSPPSGPQTRLTCTTTSDKTSDKRHPGPGRPWAVGGWPAFTSTHQPSPLNCRSGGITSAPPQVAATAHQFQRY